MSLPLFFVVFILFCFGFVASPCFVPLSFPEFSAQRRDRTFRAALRLGPCRRKAAPPHRPRPSALTAAVPAAVEVVALTAGLEASGMVSVAAAAAAEAAVAVATASMKVWWTKTRSLRGFSTREPSKPSGQGQGVRAGGRVGERARGVRLCVLRRRAALRCASPRHSLLSFLSSSSNGVGRSVAESACRFSGLRPSVVG